ncbi:hypothetical protein CT0861_06569, partial [Colletotrichum tofieldiae]
LTANTRFPSILRRDAVPLTLRELGGCVGPCGPSSHALLRYTVMLKYWLLSWVSNLYRATSSCRQVTATTPYSSDRIYIPFCCQTVTSFVFLLKLGFGLGSLGSSLRLSSARPVPLHHQMRVIRFRKRTVVDRRLDIPLPDRKSKRFAGLAALLSSLAPLQSQRRRLVGRPPVLLQLQVCKVTRRLCRRILPRRPLLAEQLDLDIWDSSTLPGSRLVELDLDVKSPPLTILGTPLLQLLAVDDVEI